MSISYNINDILQFQEVQEINDPIPPPRISQNVHGYFELASERGKATGLQSNSVGLSTRLDLCNSWDKDTVASANFKTEGKREGKYLEKCYDFNEVIP